MEKKALVEGIAIGALAGAIAGILLAPKSGKETRDEIKAHLEEIKDTIAARLEAGGEVTKEKYERIVAAVIGEYEAAKKITVDEAKDFTARLRDGFECIKGAIHSAAAGGCACAKAAVH